MAIGLPITVASRRTILSGLAFFPFVAATAVPALAETNDPVLAALEIYAQARADAEVLGDAYMQIDCQYIDGKIDDAENTAAETIWHDALDRKDDAAKAVLRAKPTTEAGALELARFASTMTEQFAQSSHEGDFREIGVACRTLGDWLIARRRARLEA